MNIFEGNELIFYGATVKFINFFQYYKVDWDGTLTSMGHAEYIVYDTKSQQYYLSI